MKVIVIGLLLGVSTNLLACPSGNDFSADQYGNDICLGDQGQLTAIVGSIKRCPTIYSPNVDKYGNDYCGYNDIHAYDLSKGCLAFMMQATDKFGNTICTLNGKPVVALIKNIQATQFVTFGH